MNDLLKDIDVLLTVRNAVKSGVEVEKTVDLLDKVIELKAMEITKFERDMEQEFMNGTDCS